ncbi:hypothetical protein DWG93_12580 [Escherichia coli]|nr:hypothetical protein [Escherichia coli]EFO1628594.1 hypothetical protein [Escherichia coli]
MFLPERAGVRHFPHPNPLHEERGRDIAGCGVNALSGLQERANSINGTLFCRPDKRSASGN